MEEFAIFVNFECHNNYFRPGPRLLYAKCSFKGGRTSSGVWAGSVAKGLISEPKQLQGCNKDLRRGLCLYSMQQKTQGSNCNI